MYDNWFLFNLPTCWSIDLELLFQNAFALRVSDLVSFERCLEKGLFPPCAAMTGEAAFGRISHVVFKGTGLNQQYLFKSHPSGFLLLPFWLN